MEMRNFKLKDLLEIKNGSDHKKLKDGKYPVYGSGGVMRYVDTFIYDKESILLPRKGTLDNIQYVNQPFWTVDTAYYTVINQSLVVPYYLYRYLSLLDLSGLDSGTGVPSMTYDSYYNINVELPSLDEQKRIAKVLTDIDSKIALNKKINKELETMAKEIYDYWFVQFDFPNAQGKPYKSSGGKMVYNPLLKREIPEGWEVKTLLDIATFTNGLACQKFRPTDENKKLPVIKIREMHDGITEDTEWVKSDISESVKVYNGDVLFSWSATLEVLLWCYGNGGLNQHIFKVTSNNGYPKSFYYFQLQEYIKVFKRMAEARKTTMGHITQDHLEQSQIVVPDNMDILNQFEKLIQPIFRKLVLNNEEISKYNQLRDELLPLLMNGQVSVKE